MQAFLVCDDERFGRSIRQVLVREGVDCPTSGVISFEQASRRLTAESVGLVIAVLPNDPIQSVEALDILAAVPRKEQTLVIAIGPAADSKLVIRALRGIVDDYVDMDEVDTELTGALAGWRQRSSAGRPEGKLIAVLSPNGGSGSSVVAASLAAILAKQHKSSALIDMKLESGDLAAMLDVKPTYTLADISQHIDRVDQVFFERALVPHDSGIRLLAPPQLLADVEAVSAEGVRQSISFARALFPFVVTDMDHTFREEQMPVLRQADLILLVFRLDFTSLRNTRRFVDHLDGLGIPIDRVRLVANRYGQAREVPKAKAEEALKMKISFLLPEDPKTVNRAINHGVPVVLDAPSAKISKIMAKMVETMFAARAE